MMNAKKPHFLEIFLPNLSSDRLEVPFKFIKHLKGKTSGSVSLIGPSGNSWHVDLTDHNGHLFFHGGWPTFVKDHALQCGDTLVFRYDGNLHFTVQIFDETSCEKEEALNAICSQGLMDNYKRNSGSKRKRGKEDSVLNVDGENKQRDTSIPVPLDLPAGYILKEIEICRIENEHDGNTEEFNASEPIVLALRCVSNTEWQSTVVKPYSKKQLYDGEKSMKKVAKNKQKTPFNASLSEFVESRAAKYITSNSPYFVRVMNYSHISGNGTMKVPMKFSSVHFPKSRIKFTLKNLNGDGWMINCIPSAQRKKSSIAHTFSAGWPAFVRENGLKIEDVCIFELVSEFEMLVRILRLGVEGLENPTGNNSVNACSTGMSGWLLESPGNLSEDTSGDQFLKDSDFLNDLLLNDHEEQENDTEKITAIQEKALVIVGNHDDCTDKVLLCNAERTILNETSRDSEEEFLAEDNTNKQSTVEESPSLTFTSPFPSFMKVIMNSNVGGSHTLVVPRTFSASHLPSYKSNIVLRNMKGHSWNVVLASNGQQAKFCGGWMSFARDNGIKVGDACIFELIDKNVLQVRIFEGGLKEDPQIKDVVDDSTPCTVLPETSTV